VEHNALTAQKATRLNTGKMAIAILIVATMALVPSGIYQLARAQGTAVVIVVVHVIHTDGGTKQASDYDVQVAYARPSTHTGGSTCSTNKGTYTAIHKPGSELGTNFTIPAPSCFFATITNLVVGDTINSSPCDQPQFIRPDQTVRCTFTIHTQ
jgi:hypothetical protein